MQFLYISLNQVDNVLNIAIRRTVCNRLTVLTAIKTDKKSDCDLLTVLTKTLCKVFIFFIACKVAVTLSDLSRLTSMHLGHTVALYRLIKITNIYNKVEISHVIIIFEINIMFSQLP